MTTARPLPHARARLLVAEDEWLIVDQIARSITGTRFELAAKASTVGRALDLIDRLQLDAAIVDGNLADAAADPLAERLAARRIPFLLLTASPAVSQRSAFRSVPLLLKPFAEAALVATLEGLLPVQRGP